MGDPRRMRETMSCELTAHLNSWLSLFMIFGKFMTLKYREEQ